MLEIKFNSTNGFSDMYNDQKLTDISNRLLIDKPENADSKELQLAIYSNNINGALIDSEMENLTKNNI
jgi:hypothetical protein